MYILLVYDMKAERTHTIYKKCSEYLNWKQNSVFEDEITKSQLQKLKEWIDSYTLPKETVIIYEFRSVDAFKKHTFGNEKEQPDFI